MHFGHQRTEGFVSYRIAPTSESASQLALINGNTEIMRLPFPIRLKGVFGIPPKTRQASAERYVSPGDMSMLSVASGDMDEAFAWLKKAYEQRDASLVWSKVAPESDLLRSDCRFQQFLGRMNFSQ